MQSRRERGVMCVCVDVCVCVCRGREEGEQRPEWVRRRVSIRGVCAIQRTYVDVGNKACAPPFLGLRKRAFRLYCYAPLCRLLPVARLSVCAVMGKR